MYTPNYLKLLSSGELKKRVKILNDKLKNCVLCPHKCGVNRLKGEKGYCNTLENVVISGAQPHLGEERELVGTNGSGTIFFSHCNLKCVFCQNYEISHCGEGQNTTVDKLAEIMLSLQQSNCHNINLVSPGHIIPQIVEAIFIAAKKGLNIPIVYNTNGYDLSDTLKLLDGIVDIYLADIKFSDDTYSDKYLGAKNYYSITKEAIKEMFNQVGNLKTYKNEIAYRGLIIRHLILPENLAGTEKIMKFLSKEISNKLYINIMAQYFPEYEAYKYKGLERKITEKEYLDAINIAKSVGLTNVKTAYDF